MANLPFLNIPFATTTPAPFAGQQTPPRILGGNESAAGSVNTPMHDNSPSGADMVAPKHGNPVSKPADTFGALLAKQLHAASLPATLPGIADTALSMGEAANPVSKDDTDMTMIASSPSPIDPGSMLATMLQLPAQNTVNISDGNATDAGQPVSVPMAALSLPAESSALPVGSRPYGTMEPNIPLGQNRSFPLLMEGDMSPIVLSGINISRPDDSQRTQATRLQFQPAEVNSQPEEIQPAVTPAASDVDLPVVVETVPETVKLSSGTGAATNLTLHNPGIVQGSPSPVNSLVAQNQPGNLNPVILLHGITTPLGNNGWREEFVQTISWISRQNSHIAELHLNPPELGPLDVVLEISGQQAAASFSSPHGAVRDSIENALPLLRDKLAENGISLINTTVSDQSSRNDREGKNMHPGFSSEGHAQTQEPGSVSSKTAPEDSPTQKSRRHNGMIDTFA